MRARSTFTLGFCAGLLALVVGGCFGDDRPTVGTETASSGEVTQVISAPARVDAAARQDVAASLPGTVAALAVEDGAQVEAGQVVMRLESAQVDVAREQAALAEAAAGEQGGVSVGGTGAATRQATEQAVADLDTDVAPRLVAARHEAIQLADADQRAAVLAVIDSVEAAYRATRTTLLSSGRAVAEQQDLAAQAFTRALNEALRQASAPQRAQAQAAAAAAERQADQLVLVAPFDGIIRLGTAAASDGSPLDGMDELGLAGLSLGDLPGAGGGGTLRTGAPVSLGQTLFTVYDLSQRYVNADVDEVDAPLVAAGQQATVLVDAAGEAELDGIVESIDVEAATTAAGGVGYPTRIRLLDADVLDTLRIGMTAGAEITTKTVQADLVVPSRALIRRQGQTVVYVVRDETAHQVPVDVEVLGEQLAAVQGDLEPGAAVVVTGYEDLADGAAVRVATDDGA